MGINHQRPVAPGTCCTERGDPGRAGSICAAFTPWFPGHLFFFLGAHHHIEVSNLTNTLHPQGWHSILSECCFRDGASVVHCAEKGISAFYEAGCLCVQYVISSSIPWLQAHSPTSFTVHWVPWSCYAWWDSMLMDRAILRTTECQEYQDEDNGNHIEKIEGVSVK